MEDMDICTNCQLPLVHCCVTSKKRFRLQKCKHVFGGACLFYHVKKNLLDQKLPRCPVKECSNNCLSDLDEISAILFVGLQSNRQVDEFFANKLLLFYQDPRFYRVQLYIKIMRNLSLLCVWKEMTQATTRRTAATDIA